MREWKKLLALVSVAVFVWWSLLTLVMYGDVLDDPEYEEALAWAIALDMPGIDQAQERPFFPVTREQAAQWYVKLAQYKERVPWYDEDCVFDDVWYVSWSMQEVIILSCHYDFFKWTEGKFYGNQYVTKANSLVALIRGLYPWMDFPLTDPYWEPYVNKAYDKRITKRKSNPYMMYLITHYELLLQLRRASKV